MSVTGIPLSSSMKPTDIKLDHHVTRFGGERNDIVSIQLNYTPSPKDLCSFLLEDIIAVALPDLKKQDLIELLRLGSVYVTRIQPHCNSQPEHEKHPRCHRRFQQRIQKNNGQYSPNAPRLTRRLTYTDFSTTFPLPSATLSVRIYLSPQRFPITPYVKWADRVCYINEKFVVVDKPAGIPSQPVASNYQECVHVQAGLALLNSPLYPTSRLDLWTSGLLCVARNPQAAHEMNDYQRRNVAQKTYRALTFHPDQSADKRIQTPYTLEHWMLKGPIFGLTVPRVLFCRSVPGSQHCIARILNVSRRNFSKDFHVRCNEATKLNYHTRMTEEIQRLQSLNYNFYDFEIQLVTGRTHQLRAQLSSFGFPIVGDTMYYPLTNISVDHLCPERITKTLNFSPYFRNPPNDALPSSDLSEDERHLLKVYLETKPVTYPIGLTSFSLEVQCESDLPKICLSSPWWVKGRY